MFFFKKKSSETNALCGDAFLEDRLLFFTNIILKLSFRGHHCWHGFDGENPNHILGSYPQNC